MQDTQSTKQTELVWYWNKSPIPLAELQEGQLNFIKKSIKQTKHKVWFGIRSKIWLKALEELAAKREEKNIDEIAKQIANRRSKKIERVAYTLTGNIMKAFNKNNYN